MAEQASEGVSPKTPTGNGDSAKTGDKKREIKGGLPYVAAPGTLKKALDGIIVAERPERFSGDFMNTILKIRGGSARPVPPMLKKMQFLTSDGAPTELYSKFKSDSARGQAALDGLKNAFSEMFRRNDFIHRADENAVKDVIVEITGLRKNDQIVRLISQTFEVVRGFADKTSSPSAELPQSNAPDEDAASGAARTVSASVQGFGLSYHINVVLPETENIAVFNAIFKSLKENLLR